MYSLTVVFGFDSVFSFIYLFLIDAKTSKPFHTRIKLHNQFHKYLFEHDKSIDAACELALLTHKCDRLPKKIDTREKIHSSCRMVQILLENFIFAPVSEHKLTDSFFVAFNAKCQKKCTDWNADSTIYLGMPKWCGNSNKRRRERKIERFLCGSIFLYCCFWWWWSITCTGVQCAMCDIVLLSAVKESIHLEEEQATINNEKKKKVRIERQSKSIFYLFFSALFSNVFFSLHEKGKSGKGNFSLNLPHFLLSLSLSLLLLLGNFIWLSMRTYCSYQCCVFLLYLATNTIENLQLQHHHIQISTHASRGIFEIRSFIIDLFLAFLLQNLCLPVSFALIPRGVRIGMHTLYFVNVFLLRSPYTSIDIFHSISVAP